LDKIKKDNARVEDFRKNKQKLMNEKFKILRKLDKERQDLMEDFNLKKATNKLDLKDYAKKFDIDIEKLQGNYFFWFNSL